jgi:ADP-L-glycero-D-manno-heptose 6-epimerase
VPFIYASSAATYGDGSLGFDDDGRSQALARLAPLNPYGESKHAFDLWVARAVEAGAPAPPRWAGLKFFNVYGPNEFHKGSQASLVPQIYARARKGEPYTRCSARTTPTTPMAGRSATSSSSTIAARR